jgi:pimeloyl-ACP methyl ester carboxylesterase
MTHCRPAMLEHVHCPVLLLNGRFDQLRIGARAYLRACPSAREQIIRGAGHLSGLDRPEAFADALLRFARTVTDSAERG